MSYKKAKQFPVKSRHLWKYALRENKDVLTNIPVSKIKQNVSLMFCIARSAVRSACF